jgi:hypothetical protein
MVGPRPSEVLEQIRDLQAQQKNLAEIVKKLIARVEAIERRPGSRKQPGRRSP